VSIEIKKKKNKSKCKQVSTAHAYNLSYSESRNQENLDSKPPRANSSQDPISKILNKKKGWQRLKW
jgi:hypothetical protein